MATGSSSWDGLGMGLFGEYQLTQITAATDMLTITGAATSGLGDFLVCEDSDGTELAMIRGDGSFRSTVASDAGVRGIDCRFTGTITAQGFNVCANFVTTLGAVSMSASQSYAIRGHLDCSCIVTRGGGRTACLMLYMQADSSAGGTNQSFIHIDDAATKVQNFLTLGNCALDESFFTTSTHGAGTKGLRIAHGSDIYYIMVTSCTS
jgi:hypothetical protein